jgi:uncharacterized protein (TIGR02147 family)
MQLGLGLLRKDGRGLIKPTDTAIAAGPLMRRSVLKKYQLQCLRLAESALNGQGFAGLSTSTNVFGVSEECYEELKEKLLKFKSEIRTLIQKDGARPTRVYHLNIFLFPGTDATARKLSMRTNRFAACTGLHPPRGQ